MYIYLRVILTYWIQLDLFLSKYTQILYKQNSPMHVYAELRLFEFSVAYSAHFPWSNSHGIQWDLLQSTTSIVLNCCGDVIMSSYISKCTTRPLIITHVCFQFARLDFMVIAVARHAPSVCTAVVHAIMWRVYVTACLVSLELCAMKVQSHTQVIYILIYFFMYVKLHFFEMFMYSAVYSTKYKLILTSFEETVKVLVENYVWIFVI